MMEKINQNTTYDQIKKNTVKADNQLKGETSVTFENWDGKGIRVLFVGNSITRHGVAHEIGWHNDWGMAASSKDKDYVHRIISRIEDIRKDGAYCICQVASWERGYMQGIEKFHEEYQDARDFQADIIILRMIENCSFDDWNSEIFKAELKKLIAYFDPMQKSKVIITTGFWKHCGDAAVCEFAERNNIPLVKLDDLGERTEMKAVGLFEHEGVANHPGDLGMKCIADRIFETLKNYL